MSHGYLGNAGFVENPWAADLAAMNVVSLFLDRRGHGGSYGTWWPSDSDLPPGLATLAPDIHAAVAYLRALAPLVDPARLALIGHSDGGTSVLAVGSVDWEIAATIAFSASLAPWEYVNHVVPRNLLLLYGAEDRFVLSDTDAVLIRHATRGRLNSEGAVGDLYDGSARRLTRVNGAGHVDLFFVESARREALEWLAGTFDLQPPIDLGQHRFGWVALGVVALAGLLLCWNGLPPGVDRGDGIVTITPRASMVIAGWVVGLGMAASIGPTLVAVPVRESGIVTAALAAELLVLGGLVLLVVGKERGADTQHPRLQMGGDVVRGAAAGVMSQAAFELVIWPVYATPLHAQRMLLFAMFLALALPAFLAICKAAGWVGAGRGTVARGVAMETFLAALTAALASSWFVRMSILPIAVLALVLFLAGMYRAGGRTSAKTAGFAAVMYARSASLVCAFY